MGGTGRSGGRPRGAPTVARHTDGVILSRRSAVFLVLAGVFSVAVWPRFGLAVWRDQRAWQGEIGASTPTGFLWVHAVLIVAAMIIGVGVAAVGVRTLLATRRASV